MRPFRQVDVFSSERYLGNPVAVVHDADGLTEREMASFARWTNLSETTFLLAPTAAEADYRMRIFTPGGELPFAGHPTLGTAHAWLESGGRPRGDKVIQECAAGLVELRREPSEGGAGRLAFATPPLLRDGPVDDDLLARLTAPLGLRPADVVDARWCDNGPGWVGLRLATARAVLAVTPNFAAIEHKTGLIGLYPGGEPAAAEVRALCPPSLGVGEDPVTGSLNGALAQWLAGTVLPSSYVVAQGTVLGRRGRVHLDRAADGTVWVGGETHTTVVGTVSL